MAFEDVTIQDKVKNEPDIADGLRTVVKNVVFKVDDEEIFSDCKEAPEDDLELGAVKKPVTDNDGAANDDAKTEFVEAKTDEVVMAEAMETVEEGKTEYVEARAVKIYSDEVTTVEENMAHSSKNNSFASEAVGSGDIAAFVGETLDRMGGAIEDLNNFNLEASKAAGLKEGGVEDYDDSGSKILGGDDDLVSEGSWSIVVEEGFGHAAQVAPALFNSDMRLNENVARLTHSIDESSSSSGSNLSSVRSVPTAGRSDTTKDVFQGQLERWADQMEQL